MKKIFLAIAILLAVSSAAAPGQTPSHPLSHINPVDVDLNMSGRDIFNVSEIRFKNGRIDFEYGLKIQNRSFLDNTNTEVLFWNASSDQWEMKNSDLDLNSNEINDYFNNACGAGEVISHIYDNGTFQCTSLTASVADQFVDESGDTMTGDLNLSNNSIRNISSITGSVDGNQVVLRPSEMLVGGEYGWAVEQLHLTDGRFDFDPRGGIAEFRVSGSGTGFNIYNTADAQYYLKFDSNKNLQIPNGNIDVNNNEVQNVVSNSGGDAVNRSFVLSNSSIGTDDQNIYVDNSTTNATITIEGGNSITLWDRYVDADANPSNELQSIQASGNQVTLSSDGSLIFVPYANESDTLDGQEGTYYKQNLADVLSQDNSVGANNIDLNNNDIQNFFDNACGSSQALKHIFSNGTFVCTDVITKGLDVESLNATLEAGNLANQSIFMTGNNINGVDTINSNGRQLDLGGSLDLNNNEITDVYKVNLNSGLVLNDSTAGNGGGGIHVGVTDANRVWIAPNDNGTWDYNKEITYDPAVGAWMIENGLILSGSLNMNNNQISNVISNSAGDAVNKSYVDNNDDDSQTLSVDNSTVNATISISNGNSVTIWDRYVDADANPSNEFQTISVNGQQVQLSDSGGLIFVPYANESDTLDGQEGSYYTQSLNVDSTSINDTITLTNGGGSINIFDQYQDADANPSNELQSIQVSGNQLSLSSDGALVFAPYANDSDTLDGVQLANIDWSDVAMAQSDISVSDLGAADANLDMNGFEVQNVISNSPGDAVNRSWVNNNDENGTDDQTLSVDSTSQDDQITIENGNTITIDDDTIEDNQTLAEVLDKGNSAGVYNIDMNNNDINNFFGANCAAGEVVTRVYSNGSYSCADVDELASDSQNLSEVLKAGNEAGSHFINMTGNDIRAIGDLQSEQGVSIVLDEYSEGTYFFNVTRSDGVTNIISASEAGSVRIPNGNLAVGSVDQNNVLKVSRYANSGELDDLGVIQSSTGNTGIGIRYHNGSSYNLGLSVQNNGNIGVPSGNIVMSEEDSSIQIGAATTQLISDQGTQLRIQGQNSASIGSYHTGYVEAISVSQGDVNIPNGDLDMSNNNISDIRSIDGGGDAIRTDDNIDLNGNSVTSSGGEVCIGDECA